MARFSIFIFSLTLIFSASVYGAIDCSNVRQCNRAQVQIFEVKASTCISDRRTYKCSGLTEPDQKAHLRPCTMQSECEEQETWLASDDVFPGCTGLTTEKRKSILAATRNALADDRACMSTSPDTCATNWFGSKAVQLYNMGWAIDKGIGSLFVGAANLGAKAGNGNLHPVSSTQSWWSNKRRRWACLDNMGKYKLMCESAGGVFEATLVAGAIRRSVVEAVIDQSGRNRVKGLAVRESVLAEKSTGARVRTVVNNSAPRARAAAAAAPVVGAVRAAARPTETATAADRAKVAETQREEYVRRLVGRQNTTVAERRAFAELAARTRSDGKTVFVDIQNSQMKYLNDHLGDKNIVTAITNRRMELAFQKLEELKSKYPQMEALKYDDFKSARFALHFADGKVPAGFMADLKQIFASADAEFVDELVAKGVIGDPKLLEIAKTSAVTGIGSTAADANLGARTAKRTGAAVVDTSGTAVRKNLGGRLQQTEIYRSGMMTALKTRPKLVKTLANGQMVPSLDVMEAFRKSESAAELRTAIEKRTGESLSAQGAQSLFTYLKQLDEWSTGLLLVEDRQSVSFVGSKFNGVTIDVSGMGALNMQQLAEKLAGVKDVTPAIEQAVVAEQEATKIFVRNKKAIVDSAQAALTARGYKVEVAVSGDDIIIKPTNQALDADALGALQDAVAKSSSSSNVRLSAVAPGAATADNLAVAGELLEKEVRSRTMTSVPAQNNYNIMVVTDASGGSSLRVSARAGEVPDSVRAAFEAAFSAAKSN